jgi:hypothetical protein
MTQPSKHLPAIATWGFIQVALLGIGASGFPLWAHHPFPRESAALPVLLCGQVLLIGILFPNFVFDAKGLAVASALMFPLDELAGLLSSSPQTIVCMGYACGLLWMVGVVAWGRMLTGPRKQIVVAMLLTLMTAGGAVFDYLRWEASAIEGKAGRFSPISLLPNLCKLTLGEFTAPTIQIALPAVTGGIVCIMLYSRKFRSKSSSTSLHLAR